MVARHDRSGPLSRAWSRPRVELAASLALALALVPLASVVNRASQRASAASLGAAWACSLLLIAVLVRSRSRYPRVLGTFAVALGLSTFATDEAANTVGALMLLSVLSGFAILLGVPQEARGAGEP